MSTGLTRSNTHAASSLARSSTLRGTRGGAGGGGDEGGGSSSTSLARASSVAVGSMSRFRNAFGAVLPDKFYEGLAVAVTSPALLRCNDRFFATPWSTAAGGLSGSLAVHSLANVGKVNRTPFLIRATGEQLLDYDFNPFDPTVIATAGREAVVKVWQIPRDGVLATDLTVADFYLAGHEKRVDMLKFHPTVKDLLLTASSDMTMRLWDFRKMQEVQILEGFEEQVLGVAWSWAGDLVLQSCKDGKIHLYDARAKNTPVRTTGTDYSAAKGLGLCFINESFDFITTGFDKNGDRQVYVWDGRFPEKPLQREAVGNLPGHLTPHFDSTVGLLYLSSKGEGIRVYDYTEGTRTIKSVSEVKTEKNQTAVSLMPKYVCDVDKFEVARFLKLCNDSYVQTVSIRVPRKASKYFPEDLYPPTPDSKPTLDIEQWQKGAVAMPIMRVLKPEGAVSVFDAPPEEGGLKRSVTRIKKKAVELPEGVLQWENRGYLYSTWENRWVSMLGSRLHVSLDRDDAKSLMSIAFTDIEQVLYYTARDDDKQVIFGIVLRSQVLHRFKTPSDKDRDRWLKALGDATSRKPTMSAPGAQTSGAGREDGKIPMALRAQHRVTSENAKKTVRGEVFKDGVLDMFSDGWFSRWAKRYVIVQEGVLYTFATEQAFLDSTSAPLESIRLETVVSIRMCDVNAATEEATWFSAPELNVFQITTPKEAIIFKAPDAQSTIEWIHLLMKISGKAVSEARRKRDNIPEDEIDDEEENVEEVFGPVVEGFVTEGNVKQWLSIINGDFYYYKTNLAKVPTKIIRSADVTGFGPLEQSGANGFQLTIKGQHVPHVTRTDILAQWWVRKIKQIQDANYDLTEVLGLKTVALDAVANEALNQKMASLIIDPLKVKNGEQPMLIQLNVKRPLGQQVKLDKSSLTVDSSFVLDAGSVIYQWNGPQSSRVCSARGADLANRIRMKDRGGNATIVFLNDAAGRGTPFHKFLGIKASSELDADNLPPASTEPFKGIKIYKVKPEKETKRILELVFDETDKLPSKDLLENDFNFVIDADTEIFVWSGSFSSIQERKLAHLLAGCLATQPGRPKDVFITRVLQNSEMMIFKEKFGDYPGMLPVNVTPMNEGNENYVKMEQPEIDIPALQAPKFAAEEDIDDGKGTIDAMWIIRKRKKAFGDNYEFDKELLNEKEYGTFYSGESYLLRYKYTVKSTEKYLVYFWQGRDSSITEKGASALETINVSDEIGGDATQIRVEQGKEPRHFILLFGGIVIHLGKQQVDRTPGKHRHYQVRELQGGVVRAVETENSKVAYHSEHVTVVVSGRNAFCWNGKYSTFKAQQAVKQDNILRLPSLQDIQSVDEGSEPQALLDLYGKDEWTAREPGAKQQKAPTYLYVVSGSSGVVVIEPHQVFTQDDLENSHVYILDCITEIYVWIGGKSMQNEKTIGMETAQKLIVNSSRGHKSYANVWTTYPFEEPHGFQRHFHCWSTSKFPEKDKKRQSVMRPVDVVLDQLNTKSYPLAVLKADKLPEGVDRSKLEEYLSNSEFQQVFEMSKADFLLVPKWKQEQLKRQKGLF